jgi:vitamin B12 transporter
MIRACTYLVSIAAVATWWCAEARADQPPSPAGGAPGVADDPASKPAVEVIVDPNIAAIFDPNIAALRDAAGPGDPRDRGDRGEEIEIFDERPDKPFDRDTTVRLTGAELAAQGAVDLATALALLPDVTVRDAGRGGFNVDIRGARKGAVSIFVDGVQVSDPYYGTFDVSTIPITDIVQIRVATTPQSPIDGPGGPGGVIEVHTRDAIGPQLVIARITADSLPSVGMTGTARVALAPHLALRLSGSGLGGARDLALPSDASLGESRHAVTGAGRLEYRAGTRRIAADGFIDDRHYVSPPSDVNRGAILLVDRETTARAQARADDRFGALQLQAQVFTQYLSRRSRTFLDPALTNQTVVENLQALHSGAMALATRPFLKEFRGTASATVDFEKAVVANISNQAVRGRSTLVEAAADLQYEHRRFRGDVSAGVAVPFGDAAEVWPEVKAVAKHHPFDNLELTATAAYKGRIPSLRERFEAVGGANALGAERTAHIELRAVEQLDELIHVEVAPYYKRTTGLIRSSLDPMDAGQLVNLGTIQFWGFDSQVRVAPHRSIETGVGYEYVKARANQLGDIPVNDEPIDRLPHHRWDAWVQGRFDERLSGQARVTYVGSAIDQSLQVASYALVSANLTAQLTKQYLGVLRVDDLLDARPETRTGYHTAGRVISLVVQGSWQ